MSIRMRLALWYSAVLGLAVVVLGFSVYLVISRHITNVLHERATAQSEHLLPFVADASLPFHSPHGFALPPAELLEGPDTYVQIVDRSENAIVGSRGLDGKRLDIPPNALARARDGKAHFYTLTLDGSQYLARLTPVLTTGPEPAGFIVVAVGSQEEARTLFRLRLALAVGGGLSVLMAGLGGLGVAGRALSPVADMIDTARAIALSRGFSRRLPGRGRDELSHLAQAFNEMLGSLEAAYATQQRFIADASHELRAPLTTIRANLDLLKRAEGLPPDERKAALDAAWKEAERMSRLVADLLALARADAGQPVSKVKTQLDSILLEVYDQVATMGRRVKVVLGELDPVPVQGDRDRLKQLLLILGINAIRYTPAGGVVRLSLSQEGPWAILVVADTGIGMAAADRPHIFERFYRSEAARRIDPYGSGLGLAIAQSIVEEHGGQIDVDSSPGNGSTFTVRLLVSA